MKSSLLLASSALLLACNKGVPYEQSALPPDLKTQITEGRNNWTTLCKETIDPGSYRACLQGENSLNQNCQLELERCNKSSLLKSYEGLPECRVAWRACLTQVRAQCEDRRKKEKGMDVIVGEIENLDSTCEISVSASCRNRIPTIMFGTTPLSYSPEEEFKESGIWVYVKCE